MFARTRRQRRRSPTRNAAVTLAREPRGGGGSRQTAAREEPGRFLRPELARGRRVRLGRAFLLRGAGTPNRRRGSRRVGLRQRRTHHERATHHAHREPPRTPRVRGRRFGSRATRDGARGAGGASRRDGAIGGESGGGGGAPSRGAGNLERTGTRVAPAHSPARGGVETRLRNGERPRKRRGAS